ncbi:MAG: DUF3256 family protein [Dysgonomonas sp.]
MKKIILTLTILLGNIYSVLAQDINTVFLSVPDSIIFGLEAEHKDRLLANPKDTAKVLVESTFYSRIERKGITDSYIALQTSEAGNIQIKLLPLVNDSKIICVVKTVCGDACDSQIKFYTTKWATIPQTDLFPKPTIDWFIKSDSDRNSQDFQNAVTSLDMNPIKIALSPDNDNISVIYDIKAYLSEEDYKRIQPFLIEEPKILTWDKVSYK